MTIKDLEKVHPDFEVTVQEQGKCFKYSCYNRNQTNREDFQNRKIWEIKIVGGTLHAYCY